MRPDRDAKGRYLKGHPRDNNAPGHCGGTPKGINRQVKDALKLAEDAMPSIFLAMIKRATGGDKNCPVAVQQASAEYLCNRIYGKPNQPLSGGGDVVKALLEEYRTIAKGEVKD